MKNFVKVRKNSWIRVFLQKEIWGWLTISINTNFLHFVVLRLQKKAYFCSAKRE
jgi:hypothetical protein